MKPERIVFATGNKNKMKEIRMIMEDLNLPILSMKEFSITENGNLILCQYNIRATWQFFIIFAIAVSFAP